MFFKDFIVGFQVARFLTQGLFFFGRGCFLYYRCVNFDSYECSLHGPHLSVYGACYFMLQIVLVWCAFLMLPFTSRPMMTPEVRQAHASGHVVCVDRPFLRGTGKRCCCMGGGAPQRMDALSPPSRGIHSTSQSHRSSTTAAVMGRQGHGRMLEEEIVYIYDDEGRLVEDMTENGREWTDRVVARVETKRGGHLIKMFWYVVFWKP